MLGPEQGQEVLVALGVALEALEAQLHRRHLAVLLQHVAHLAGEDLLAALQERDLGPDLAAHLQPHLAHAVGEGLQARVTLGDFQREIVVLEQQIDLRGLQPLQDRVEGLDEHAIGEARGIDPGEPRLGSLELGPLLP